MIALAALAALVVAASDVRVIDGDTVAVGAARYRVQGLDAPEVGGRALCPREAALGEAATRAAQTLLAASERVEITTFRRDRYGREVADLALCDAHGCRDFATTMPGRAIRGNYFH